MESLGIDLKLIIVQIINFGLLVLLLTKFLYKPILKVLDERRKGIAESLVSAQKIAEERAKIVEEKEKEIKKAQEIGKGIIEEMRKEAEKQREETLRRARGEAERIAERAKEQLVLEKEKLEEEIKSELTNLSIAMAERLLEGKIGPEKKEELIVQSLKKLKEKASRGISLMTSPTLKKRRISSQAAKTAFHLLILLKKTGNLKLLPEILSKLEEGLPTQIDVITAANLQTEERQKVEKTLEGVFGKKLDINFTVNLEILGGMIIKVGDRVFDNSLLGRSKQMRESL